MPNSTTAKAPPVLTRRPEWDILLCCGRPNLSDAQAQRLAGLLTEPIDFDYLLQLAIRHKMMPLLWWQLRHSQSDRIPSEWRQALKVLFEANTQRNVTLMLEMIRLVSLLEAGGVPTVAFKGPVMAVQVYGDLALRQFSDLDILVRLSDVPNARDLLRTSGYRFLDQPRHPWTWGQESALLQTEYAYTFQGEKLGNFLELHWKFTHKYRGVPLASESLWDRLASVSLAGQIVRTLAAEDLLIYLCAHGAKHAWERLEWISGLALLAEWPDIQWDVVLERAHLLRCERILLLGLQLAHVLLETPLPPHILESIRTAPEVKRLASDVESRLFVKMADTPDLVTHLSEGFLFQMRAKDSFLDRLRYCVQGMTLPQFGDWNFVPLPRALFPLYGTLRPIRLFGKHALRLIK